MYVFPKLSTATHDEDEEHETEVMTVEAIFWAADHAVPSYLKASPFESTAAQNDTDRQEIEVLPPMEVDWAADHEVPSYV